MPWRWRQRCEQYDLTVWTAVAVVVVVVGCRLLPPPTASDHVPFPATRTPAVWLLPPPRSAACPRARDNRRSRPPPIVVITGPVRPPPPPPSHYHRDLFAPPDRLGCTDVPSAAVPQWTYDNSHLNADFSHYSSSIEIFLASVENKILTSLTSRTLIFRKYLKNIYFDSNNHSSNTICFSLKYDSLNLVRTESNIDEFVGTCLKPIQTARYLGIYPFFVIKLLKKLHFLWSLTDIFLYIRLQNGYLPGKGLSLNMSSPPKTLS